MNNAQNSITGLMAIFLASCASLPISDDELSSAVNVSDKWQYINEQSSPVENGWLDELKITELSSFVNEVMKNNPNYNELALRMQASGYSSKAANGRLLPRLNASGNVNRTGVEQNIQNSPNSFPNGPNSLPANQTSFSNTTTNFTIGLDASWEIDVWGRLSSNAAAARSNYEVAQYDYEGARLSLAAQVAQNWFNVIEAKQQLDLSRRTVESFERTTRIINNRFKRGLTTGLDLRLSLSNLEDARASEKLRETTYRQAIRALELLAGKYPSAAMEITGSIPDALDDVPVGVPLDILERRPDLQSAKSRLYAAGYRAQASKKSLLPSISITARGNNTSEEFGDLLKFDNIFWNLIGGITQPIFQGGQLRYTAKADQLNFEAQKQNYAQTLLRAFKEVEDALDNDRAFKERVELRERATQNAIAAEEVAIKQYSQGLIRIATLLQSQRQSLSQQSQLLTIKRQRINNRIALYLSLGGDFAMNDETNNEQAQTVTINTGNQEKIEDQDKEFSL